MPGALALSKERADLCHVNNNMPLMALSGSSEDQGDSPLNALISKPRLGPPHKPIATVFTIAIGTSTGDVHLFQYTPI